MAGYSYAKGNANIYSGETVTYSHMKKLSFHKSLCSPVKNFFYRSNFLLVNNSFWPHSSLRHCFRSLRLAGIKLHTAL